MRGCKPGCLFLILLLGACASTSPVPEDQFYRLPEVEVMPGAGKLMPDVIYVARFSGSGLHIERAIVYAKEASGTGLGQYHYHYWIDSPADLIRDQLVHYLRASGAPGSVVATADIPADIRIFGTIRRFERLDYGSVRGVAVVLEFRVNQVGQDLPLLVKEYSQVLETGYQSIQLAMPVFGAALSDIFSDLTADLNGLLLQQ